MQGGRVLTAALVIMVVFSIANAIALVVEWRRTQKTKPRRAIHLRIVGKPEDEP